VDRAALDAALDLGVPCGGYCPRGRKAEDGVIPAKYPLQSLPSANYRDRTLKNLLKADATLIFYNAKLTGGTRLTADLCREHRRPFLAIDAGVHTRQQATESGFEFMIGNSVRMLNVAGPRKSQWPEGYGYVYEVMQSVLKLWQSISHEHSCD